MSKQKIKVDFLIRNFDREVRDAVTFHTQKVLGHKGNAKFIESLIRKALKLN